MVVALVTTVALPLRSFAATPDQVQSMIDRGKQYLYGALKDGSWEWAYTEMLATAKPGAPIDKMQEGGATALVIYALVASGENPQDPRIVQAIDSVRKMDLKGSYALGLRATMWTVLPPTEANRASMSKDAAQLKGALKKGTNSPADGFYWTQANNKGASYDHNSSQIAVLGLWAMTRQGVEVSRADWLAIETGWRKHQYDDGSWSYQYAADGKPQKEKYAYTSSVSMTAGGVASLFVAQDMLHQGEGIACRGNLRNEAIDRGMEWLSKNFNATYLAPYSMYTLARIGQASGHKYLANDFDWFASGAEWLRKKQATDGSWNDHGKVVGTAFSILFLARGRDPLVMSKLDYSAESEIKPPAPGTSAKTVARGSAFVNDKTPWNQRPRDCANISNWIGKQIERDLSWQIVNLDGDPDDLHDSPIMFVAGNKTLEFTPAQEEKLKTYLLQGGLMVANADCSGADFTNSFKKLGQKLFPSYEFGALPDSHVIYTEEQFPAAGWKKKPQVLALTNGVRVLMILLPVDDPSKAWQLNSPGGREELYQLAANLFLYSVDKQNLRYKGETYLIHPVKNIKPATTIKVARLQYAGNYDAEPAGWTRLGAFMHNLEGADVVTETVKLGGGTLKASTYPVAHLTGTSGFKLNAIQRAELKTFVTVDGGTLVIDAAGGSGEFAAAVDDELRSIFGTEASQLSTAIKPDHPLFKIGETDLGEVTYRTYARGHLDGDFKHPRLKGITINNRLGVIYSREDMSAGLVGQAVDGIAGYSPQSATTLMSKILLYAVKK